MILEFKSSDRDEDLDLYEMSRGQLEAYLEELEKALASLDAREPAEVESEEYDDWAEEHEDLEDLMDEVQDRLDEMEL